MRIYLNKLALLENFDYIVGENKNHIIISLLEGLTKTNCIDIETRINGEYCIIENVLVRGGNVNEYYFTFYIDKKTKELVKVKR